MFYQALDTGCIGHGAVGLAQGAAMAQQYGFEGFWLDAGRDFLGKTQDVKALLARHQLKPAGFSLPLEFRADEAIFQTGMDKLASRAAFAREVGINRCVTWILPAHEELNYEANFALHRDRLSQAAEVLKKEGVWLGLEFVSPPKMRAQARYPFIHDVKGMLALCDAIDTGNCGILVDAWHWHLAEHTFLDFEVFTNPRQIVCVHVCDAPVNIPAEQQEDQSRRLPGATGVINIAEFFAGLRQTGYDGPVLVEPFEAFLGKIPFEEALKTIKKYLDRVWPG